MRVFLITRECFPNGMAATNRIKCLAKAFLLGGNECRVIVYGRNGEVANAKEKVTAEGIPYERIGCFRYSLKMRWYKALLSLLSHITLFFYMFTKIREGDIVYSYIYDHCKLRKLIVGIVHFRKAYYVSELCELPYGMGKETKLAKRNRQYELEKLFPLYDGVIVISEALSSLACNHCGPKCVIQKIPILVDYEKYDLPDNSLKADFPYIFHTGTLSEQKDGIISLFEAFGIASNIINTDIHFVLTGVLNKSPHQSEIESIIKKYDLENKIHFEGYVTDDKLKDMLSKATMVIINKKKTQQNLYCFPTKLGEYLAAGKLVVLTRIGESVNWVTNGENCVLVDSDDIKQLSNAIVDVFLGRWDITKLGESAKELCKSSFDYHQYASVLNGVLNQIVQQSAK